MLFCPVFRRARTMRPPFSVETWVIIVKTRPRLTETSGKRARVVFVQWCLAAGLSSSLLHVGLQTRAEPWLLLLIKADRYIKTCEGKKIIFFQVENTDWNTLVCKLLVGSPQTRTWRVWQGVRFGLLLFHQYRQNLLTNFGSHEFWPYISLSYFDISFISSDHL